MSNQNTWNTAIDACAKLFEQWADNGRDPQELLERFSDLKIYIASDTRSKIGAGAASVVLR